MRRNEEQRRHEVPKGGALCWCGSTHSWELSKHGFCRCSRPDCGAVHRAKGEDGK
jgi:hypothetical protein